MGELKDILNLGKVYAIGTPEEINNYKGPHDLNSEFFLGCCISAIGLGLASLAGCPPLAVLIGADLALRGVDVTAGLTGKAPAGLLGRTRQLYQKISKKEKE